MKPRQTILLRSGNTLLTHERLDALADELAEQHKDCIVYADFFDQVKHLIRDTAEREKH